MDGASLVDKMLQTAHLIRPIWVPIAIAGYVEERPTVWQTPGNQEGEAFPVPDGNGIIQHNIAHRAAVLKQVSQATDLACKAIRATSAGVSRKLLCTST
jgi:hypothetical protein